MKAMQAKKYQSPPRPVAAQKTASQPAQRATIAPVVPAPDLVQVGIATAVQAFNTRNWKPLETYLGDAASADPALRRSGLSALLGVAVGLSDLLTAAHASGHVKITGEYATHADLSYGFATDIERFVRSLHTLWGTAIRVRDAAPKMTASIPPTAQRKVTKITRDTNLEAREIEELTYR